MTKKIELNSGVHHLDLYGGYDFEIVTQESSEGSLVLHFYGKDQINLKLLFNGRNTWSYLSVNHSDEALTIDEEIQVEHDTYLHLNYAELSKGSHKRKTRLMMQGKHSEAAIKAAVLTFNKLHWVIEMDHLAPYTKSQITANGIVLNQADLLLEVGGHIAKGNIKSETHQMSRIMNLGETMRGTVFPKLLIEENDVAASHAASIGQANEEHLYYLKSRGLTHEEALKLMTLGYLLPIVDEIDDELLKENLRQEIEMKVSGQW